MISHPSQSMGVSLHRVLTMF
jgi:ATP-binding cassette subfamily B (MDR/TAP) protein 1